MAMLPYGAMPDDLAEYMLGDVVVSVVLMESTPTQAPHDANQEDWTAESITAIKSKIEEGVGWWKETLLKTFPNVSDQLLNFKFNYQYADSPVATGYEPINRVSSDYQHWLKDFVAQAGLTSTGNVNADLRRFNDAQRRDMQGSWAFTIIVVNDEHDADGKFLPGSGGNFPQAFAFAADKFMIVPANRPAETFTHEMGHMFWAFDEYAYGDSYYRHRGYYDTQNLNAANAPGGNQQASIMAADSLRSQAYAENMSSPATLEIIGWKDSDGNGVFDVLDVPFKLEGSGWYDTEDSTYKFLGNSAVRTLLNQNPEGLGNDITINVVREAQYSLDGGDWLTAGTYNSYSVDLQLAIPASPGSQTLKLRTIDTITGAKSPEYLIENIQIPEVIGSSGVQGFVWWDTNADGIYDLDELPAVDVPVWIVDPATQQQLQLASQFDPEDAPDSVASSAGATFSVTSMVGIPFTFTGAVVTAGSTTAPYADQVFAAESGVTNTEPADTWNIQTRALRVQFDSPTSSVTIQVWGGLGSSRGRLEAYNADGVLLDRVTTSVLSGPNSYATLALTRAEGDIAYILAGGDMNTSVVLDGIEWGARSKVTTNSAGVYRIPELAPGAYDIKINVARFQLASTPVQGITQILVDSGAANTTSFGLVQLPNPWHNLARKYDVNNNGRVDVDDILVQLAYYKQYAESGLPDTGPGNAAFVDVNNDGLINVDDILLSILNYQVVNGVEPDGVDEPPPVDTSGGTIITEDEGSASGESPLYVNTVPGGQESDHDYESEGHIAVAQAGTGNSDDIFLGLIVPIGNEQSLDTPSKLDFATDPWTQQVQQAISAWDLPDELEEQENVLSASSSATDETLILDQNLFDLTDEPVV